MNEDRRVSWLPLVVTAGAILVSVVVTTRVPLLNFFYVPVLLVAYWTGGRAAMLVALLCLAFVLLLADLYPDQFGFHPAGAEASLGWWVRPVVWGCGLALAGYAAGRLLENVRSRRAAAGLRTTRPEIRLYNIGTLAIIKGYLRHDQVLKILQIQQKSQKRFGEIAVGLRLLTPEQVDELLRMQEEKRTVTSSEIAMAKLEIAKARKGR